MASSSSQLKKQVNVLVSGDFMLKESFYRDKIEDMLSKAFKPEKGEELNIAMAGTPKETIEKLMEKKSIASSFDLLLIICNPKEEEDDALTIMEHVKDDLKMKCYVAVVTSVATETTKETRKTMWRRLGVDACIPGPLDEAKLVPLFQSLKQKMQMDGV